MEKDQFINSGLRSLEALKSIVREYGATRIFVVTGKESFKKCGAKFIVENALKDYETIYFSDFEVNQKIEYVIKGVNLIHDNKIELLICVGGGSVIDMAKLIKAFIINKNQAYDIAKGITKVIDPDIPLLAIPTTAGSGSESTHFAVVYINKEKFSVADECLLPSQVILDGNLATSASRYQKAANVLDAISQSIESAWSVSATYESQKIAYQALELCMEHFHEYVNIADLSEAAQSMIVASNMAGKAINISKTTAAHAWSYGISSNYGVSHGHAVWFTLPKIFEIHNTISKTNLHINDPRGRIHLQETMSNLKNILGICNDKNINHFFKEMLNSIGISADFEEDLLLSELERMSLSKAVNKERMGNNPIKFDSDHISSIFNL